MSATFTDNDGVIRLVGTITGAGGGDVVTRELSSAELLDIMGSPVEVVPAPGPGNVLVLIAQAFTYLAGTTPYTPNGGSLAVQYGDEPATAYRAYGYASTIDQAASTFGTLLTDTGSFALADYEDAPLVIAGSTADPTDGDGTLVVSLSVITVAV